MRKRSMFHAATTRLAAVIFASILPLAGGPATASAQTQPVAAGGTDTVNVEVLQAEKLTGEGQNKAALDIFNRYLADHPRDARALADRGDVYESLEDQRSAIADYTAALAVNPDFAYAYASRCQSRWEVDQNELALQDCSKAIE